MYILNKQENNAVRKFFYKKIHCLFFQKKIFEKSESNIQTNTPYPATSKLYQKFFNDYEILLIKEF